MTIRHLSYEAKTFFKTWASAFGVFLSCVALFFACQSNGIAKQALETSQHESAVIQIENVHRLLNHASQLDYATKIIRLGGKDSPIFLMPVLWRVTISNTSDRTFSIIREALLLNEHPLKARMQELMGSDSTVPISWESGGFFSAPETAVSLPLAIAPGESRVLLYQTQVALDRSVVAKLVRHQKFKRTFHIKELLSFLDFQGTDIYSNDLKGSGSELFRQDRFRLVLQTARGTFFDAHFSWYSTHGSEMFALWDHLRGEPLPLPLQQ